MHVDEFPDLDRSLADFPVDVVFGHLGYVPASRKTSEPGFQALLRLMKDGKAWVKLSAPYRLTASALPDDANLLKLLEHWVPDREMRKRILVDHPARLYRFTSRRA